MHYMSSTSSEPVFKLLFLESASTECHTGSWSGRPIYSGGGRGRDGWEREVPYLSSKSSQPVFELLFLESTSTECHTGSWAGRPIYSGGGRGRNGWERGILPVWHILWASLWAVVPGEHIHWMPHRKLSRPSHLQRGWQGEERWERERYPTCLAHPLSQSLSCCSWSAHPLNATQEVERAAPFTAGVAGGGTGERDRYPDWTTYSNSYCWSESTKKETYK